MKATFVRNQALWMNYHSERTKGSGEAYSVQVQQHIPGGPESFNTYQNRFQPSAGLTRNDSSTLLMFLMNGYTYSDGPVDDPWFKTTQSKTIAHGAYDGDRYETWFADYSDIGTLACFEEDEICNTAHRENRCTPVNPYGSSLREGDLGDLLQLNPKQRALAKRLADALGKSAFGDMVVELNGASMLARKRSFDSTGISLPSNQWTLELQQWFSTSLADTEMAVKQFVTGYGEPYDRYVVSPAADDSWMCYAQVIKSDAYSSFSVLGLGLILVFGGLIMLLNIVTESVARQLRTRSPGPSGLLTQPAGISNAS